ncbi:hypothetical protein H4P12_00890 [Paracoccus sp. 11-3]|uniref:Aa3 type cytochrome c oxidase subunit IV n=1 Tax=Paracoccus amoyensis TaxID=2760093 RepID=A0A926GBI2_9RHOB|nr:hypothetical protein [Paracoccus amoyensis]MBC9245297.1 hypothetical protein [Paracoccus amoyensis]
MYDIETEFHLRQMARDEREPDNAESIIRWALVLTNMAVLAVFVVQLI